MPQKLDTGETLGFGQSLDELERLFSCKAVDNPSPVARKGLDKQIRLKNISLDFDSGRLTTMEFKLGYDFKNPLTPFPEAWKDMPAIGTKAIHGKMPREGWLAYLSSWEQRAKELGAEKVHPGDLAGQQFAVVVKKDKFIDMVHISMGPSRRAGGGGIWCDGWSFFFTMDLGFPARGLKPGLLESVAAFRDEFNTVARRKAGSSEPELENSGR